MSRLAIQNEIATAIRAITGVENVYTEPESFIDYQDVINKAVEAENEFLQIWSIRRVSSLANGPRIGGTTSCTVNYVHEWDISLWWGYIAGESEEHFQALIDAVILGMAGNRTFNESAFGSEAPISLQSIRDEPMFQIVGTRARFRLSTAEIVVVNNT